MQNTGHKGLDNGHHTMYSSKAFTCVLEQEFIKPLRLRGLAYIVWKTDERRHDTRRKDGYKVEWDRGKCKDERETT